MFLAFHTSYAQDNNFISVNYIELPRSLIKDTTRISSTIQQLKQPEKINSFLNSSNEIFKDYPISIVVTINKIRWLFKRIPNGSFNYDDITTGTRSSIEQIHINDILDYKQLFRDTLLVAKSCSLQFNWSDKILKTLTFILDKPEGSSINISKSNEFLSFTNTSKLTNDSLIKINAIYTLNDQKKYNAIFIKILGDSTAQSINKFNIGLKTNFPEYSMEQRALIIAMRFDYLGSLPQESIIQIIKGDY